MQPPLSKEYFPDKLAHWSQTSDYLQFTCENGCVLRLHLLSDQMVRFRFSPEGYFSGDFSYGPDPRWQPAPPIFSVHEQKSYLSIKTEALDIRLRRQDLRTRIFDRKGNLLLDDDKGFHWEESHRGGNIVMMSKRAYVGESYFGLGDKSCHLNLRGHRLHNWVTDSFGYSTTTDPLYRAIPFYFGLHNGRGYGIFFDNSFRSHFDFAKERHDATSFWADGGEMNYYFIAGPELMQVAERYTLLTGRPELPPMWALGFHQCKWSYYPEAKVREIAREFRARKIPCDALYLDIDYMDDYRCFTWNHEHFPRPQTLLQDLKDQGFRTVVIIDPGIKIDPEYEVFRQGLAKEYYCRRPDGPFYRGKVWPGECYFPDFTQPEVRQWWASLFRDLMQREGVDGIWNDMNEPAIFEVETKTFPDDVRHDYDGHPCSHLKAHNIYGMQMSRASFEGMKHFGYPKRPFLLTRATYAGGQRYAAAWTGDNVANWHHLHLASIQSQRMSVSGMSFVGSDIGGFNDIPDGELFVRWLQMGIFHPLFRVHSIGYNFAGDAAVDEEVVAENVATSKRDQEPWSFGEPFTSQAKQAIELRYQLLPFLYTTYWQYVTYGRPFLRPLSFLAQDDPETHYRQDEFGVGDHLLVCPITEPGATGRYLYLPRGLWYDFRDDRPVRGEQEIYVKTAPMDIPIFVQAGAVLPLGAVKQHVNDHPEAPLTLHLYYKNGSATSWLYLDEGDGYDYLQGRSSLRRFDLNGSANGLQLTQRQEGTYPLPYDQFKVVVHGLPFRQEEIKVDGHRLAGRKRKGTLELKLPVDFHALELK
jgi:alpha-glucosidase